LGWAREEVRSVKRSVVIDARSTAGITAAEVAAHWSQTGLNRTQQFASRAAGSIEMRVRFRAMAIDLIRLACDDTEQFFEVFHKVAPDLR